MKFFHKAVLIWMFISFTGCGTSPSSIYPNFATYKFKMTSAALLADCVIIDDMVGDTNKIDVVTNKSLGGMILTHFTDKMIEKGYHIDHNMLTSVGLLMDPRRVYKLVQSVRTRETDLEDLPIGLPPFYLDEAFQNDSAALSLVSTYNALLQASPQEDGTKTFIPSATAVGQYAEAETILIVLLGGFSASASKQYNDESASDASTIGKIAVQHISQVTVALYIIDSPTGELLWSDQRKMQGGTVYKEKILLLADKIIEALP